MFPNKPHTSWNYKNTDKNYDYWLHEAQVNTLYSGKDKQGKPGQEEGGLTQKEFEEGRAEEKDFKVAAETKSKTNVIVAIPCNSKKDQKFKAIEEGVGTGCGR